MSLLTNIQAYWKFDESSGNAVDSVVSKVLTNNGGVVFDAGKINNGADFGSANSSKSFTALSMPFMSGYGGGPLTVSVWVKFQAQPATNGTMSIVYFLKSTNVAGSDFGFQCAYQDVSGTKKLYFWTPFTGMAGTYAVTLTTGTWYHVCTTIDASKNWVVYLNGTSVMSGTGTTGNNIGTQDQMYVGSDTTPSYMSGNVDELAIWSTGLLSSDVLQLYSSGNGFQYPFSQLFVPNTIILQAVNRSNTY